MALTVLLDLLKKNTELSNETHSSTNSEKERAKLQNAQVLFCLKKPKRTFCDSVHSKSSKKLAESNAG